MGSYLLKIVGLEFRTKSSATRFFRAMLGGYEVGQQVTEEDRLSLLDLLAAHPQATALLANPIAGFTIERGEFYGQGTKRFTIAYEDGSVGLFSYLNCISPPKDHHLRDVLWAMRCEVLEQVRAFSREAFKERAEVPCGITGQSVKPANSHVDHAPPNTFSALASSFLQAERMVAADIKVTREGRHHSKTAKYLADPEVAERWRTFHLERAVLRITTKRANLGAARPRDVS
jgi:Protein of unknown function (DUF3223)